jgi:GT2 family glycosyltransferase
VSHACREDIGCVGAKLYYPNETIQHGGVILGIGGVAGHSHRYADRNEQGYFSRLQLVQNLSAVTAACLLLRKSVFEEVGGFDEKLAVSFNDVDLCLKVLEAGYRNLWTPYAELYHHESLTRGPDDTYKKRTRANWEAEYMRKRWGPMLDSDPAYNPNLTLVHEDFSLK